MSTDTMWFDGCSGSPCAGMAGWVTRWTSVSMGWDAGTGAHVGRDLMLWEGRPWTG